MVGNGIKYDIILDAMVWGTPGFKEDRYKIPVKVNAVTFSKKCQPNPDLEKRLKGINTLYYRKQTTSILRGHRIKAYGNEKQLIEKNEPQLIQLLDDYGTVMAEYEYD